MLDGHMTVTIWNCARCNKDHNDLDFVPLLNATDEWKWFAICPITEQPILLRKEITNGGSSSE